MVDQMTFVVEDDRPHTYLGEVPSDTASRTTAIEKSRKFAFGFFMVMLVTLAFRVGWNEYECYKARQCYQEVRAAVKRLEYTRGKLEQWQNIGSEDHNTLCFQMNMFLRSEIYFLKKAIGEQEHE